MPELTRITRDPAVMGGKPCIRGIRVTVGTVVGLVAGVGVALFLSFSVHLHGSVVEGLRIPDRAQSSDSTEKGATRSGVCEREAEKLVGQKPVRIGGSVRAPKKLRDVPPKYPEQPPGTVGSGMWLGEALINNTGRVAHVWPIREVKFVPPFPAFNSAITDAMKQWEFEPLLVRGKPAAFCMTVTVNINWQ
jgi:hypothetical protein